MTDEKESARFGLVFQSDLDTPGTREQQETLRDAVMGFGFGTPRWRMLWGFAVRYKAKGQMLYGDGQGRRYVNVSVNGSGSYGWENAMVLPTWATGRDLAMSFYHEWGHQVDKYCLTTEDRNQLMVLKGFNHFDWTGFASTPHIDYWDRTAELWAWSFQRLCDPTLPELEIGWTRDQMIAALPNFDQEWVDAGLEIHDD